VIVQESDNFIKHDIKKKRKIMWGYFKLVWAGGSDIPVVKVTLVLLITFIARKE